MKNTNSFSPQDSHDPEKLSNSPDLREVADVRGVVEGDADKVGKDGQKVDDVHQRLDELGLDRGRDETNLEEQQNILIPSKNEQVFNKVFTNPRLNLTRYTTTRSYVRTYQIFKCEP